MARKDMLTRLADAGEDAIGRLGDAPGMERMLGFANSTRDRLDELTRRVRGIEELERRVAQLEKRLEEERGTKTTSAASSASKKATTKKGASAKKSSTDKTGGASPG